MKPLKALRRLGRRLFSSPATKLEPKPEVLQEPDISNPFAPEVSPPQPVKNPIPNGRGAYFVQIGLDFGTAFSKCVCRDIMIEKPWIHKPKICGSKELPFLIPSNLAFKNGYLSVPYQKNGGYLEGGLPHVKIALQKVALKKWNDPALLPYQEVRGEIEVLEFVRTCAVYLIAGILGGVKNEIESRFPGHHREDYAAVNMALPVAYADQPDVEKQFQEVLQLAWVLSDKLTNHPSTKIKDVISLINRYQFKATKEEIRKACYLYPEVSANVQGFVRSRVSSRGIYLFSDTGAGTVDQSLFIFKQKEGDEKLIFLHAAVLPLGSSYIERQAVDEAGEELEPKNLEKWRRLKEAGEEKVPLFNARHKIGEELELKTRQTIASAKTKLPTKGQMNGLKIIFGGGGLCRIPYEKYVLEQFDSHIFPKHEIRERRQENDPFYIGMPMPTELSSEGVKRNWMKRLTVAYGLAFEKSQLAHFKLPSEAETPRPENIWKPRASIDQAPTKDDC